MSQFRRALRPDAQAFDEIRIVTNPRYKTSGMSGDEWRISASAHFYRKGTEVHKVSGVCNVQTAINHLGYWFDRAIDEGRAYFGGKGDLCDQEGCANTAVVTYAIITEYCDEPGGCGQPKDCDSLGVFTRKFCKMHSCRGDCALEDNDTNYLLIDGDVDDSSYNGDKGCFVYVGPKDSKSILAAIKNLRTEKAQKHLDVPTERGSTNKYIK